MEDLQKAIGIMYQIIHEHPKRAYDVQFLLEEIKTLLPPEEHSVFSVLREEVGSLIGAVTLMETDDAVNHKSEIYPALVRFHERLKIYQEVVVMTRVFQHVESHLIKIDSIDSKLQELMELIQNRNSPP